MSLDEKLKQVVLEDIKEVNLLLFDSYSSQNSSYIKALYDQGVVDNSSLTSALETAVLKQARRDYTTMISSTTYTIYADHIGRPDCFAYALKKGEFSQGEIKKIPFDGESVISYIHQYEKKYLIDELKKQLLHYNPLKIIS